MTRLFSSRGHVLLEILVPSDRCGAMRLLPAILLMASMVAMAQTAPPTEVLVAKIERIARTETPQNRVDTLLRLAQLLLTTDAARSKRLLDESLALIDQAPTGNLGREPLVSLMALDADLGERTVLGHLEPHAAYALLLEYCQQRGDEERGARLARQALALELKPGPWMYAWVLTTTLFEPAAMGRKLEQAKSAGLVAFGPGEPGRRAQAAFRYAVLQTLRERPALIRRDGEELARLLASEDVNPPAPFTPTVFVLGSKEVELTDRRDQVLLTLGILLRDSAPETYRRHMELFRRWQEALAGITDSQAAKQAARQEPGASPARGSVDQVLEAARVEKDARTAATSLTGALYRKDLTPEQAGVLAKQSLAKARMIEDPKQRLDALTGLLDGASTARVPQPILRPAIEEAARALAKTPGAPGTNSSIARLIREEGIITPAGAPSLEARVLLLSLEESLQAAYDFSLADLSGREKNLKGLRGKVVVLNFWATWCPPCRAEMPELDKLYRELRGKGLEILAITDEESGVARDFVSKGGFQFPILLDRRRQVFDHYRVVAVPITLVLDRKGRIAHTFSGTMSEEGLRAALKAAGL